MRVSRPARSEPPFDALDQDRADHFRELQALLEITSRERRRQRGRIVQQREELAAGPEVRQRMSHHRFDLIAG